MSSEATSPSIVSHKFIENGLIFPIILVFIQYGVLTMDNYCISLEVYGLDVSSLHIFTPACNLNIFDRLSNSRFISMQFCESNYIKAGSWQLN